MRGKESISYYFLNSETILVILIEKENLCLYGLPNETWEVNLPVEEVPPELPEPALGINFARDGMQEKDWLSLVAVHSDSWLLAVAFYFGARFGFGKTERYATILFGYTSSFNTTLFLNGNKTFHRWNEKGLILKLQYDIKSVSHLESKVSKHRCLNLGWDILGAFIISDIIYIWGFIVQSTKHHNDLKYIIKLKWRRYNLDIYNQTTVFFKIVLIIWSYALSLLYDWKINKFRSASQYTSPLHIVSYSDIYLKNIREWR